MAHANNIALAAGFLSGGILGYRMPSRWLRRGLLRDSEMALRVVAPAAGYRKDCSTEYHWVPSRTYPARFGCH
jgi:hypothetical protein